MAQITRRTITPGSAIWPTSTFAVFPGLSVAILTGSGWLVITMTGQLRNNYAGPNGYNWRMTLDGQPIANASGGAFMAQGGYLDLIQQFAMRPGAGQHIITLEGYSSQETIDWFLNSGFLTVWEPGY